MNGSNGQAVLLGSLVRDRRQACGLTQRELARRAGVSVGAVRDLEQGRTRRPQPLSLSSLAQALGLSLEHLRELIAVPAADGVLLQILGPLLAWRDGMPVRLGGAARRAVLGLLALSPGLLVHREAIIDLLWPDQPPANAVNLVQAHVSRLRRLLDPGRPANGRDGLLVSAGPSYQLQALPGQLDLLDFGQLTVVARKAASRGDEEAACGAYRQALEVWRGDPLADVDLLHGHHAVAGLSRQRAEVVIEYARVAAAARWYEQVLGPLRELAGREPLNEQAHGQLMIALAGCGQQAEALAVYQDVCRRLDEELAMLPGSELSAVHQRVLRQEIVPARDRQGTGGAGAHTVADSARPVAAVARRGGPAPVVPRQLPAAPALFTGREAELSALSQLRPASAGTVMIAAVCGMAGVGKTALALHWAHQVASGFPDGQLYVNLRGFDPSAAPLPPGEALGWWLGALGVAREGLPADLEARAGLFRSLAAGRRLLIVVDNARDAEQVRPLLPGAPECVVVVTSRARLTALAVTDGARLLSLDVLTRQEARQLLATRLGAGRAAAEPVVIDELVGFCARLPLALAITAGRAAGQPGLALADLAAELAQSASRLDALEAGDAASSLRAVLSWSYEHLNPPAARMFRLAGMHPGPDITVAAAASLAGVAPSTARQMLAELVAASLVAEHTGGRFGLHDLLRAYARDQADAAETEQARGEAVARMLDHYLHTAHAAAVLVQPQRGVLALEPARPGVTMEHVADRSAALAWFETEHRVLAGALAAASQAGFDARAWQLSWAISDFLLRRGHWHDWVACQHTALQAAARSGDKAGEAAAHQSIGHAYARLGDFDRAQVHLASSARLYRDLGDRVGDGRVCQILGWIAERQGRYAEVLRQARQALALFQAAGNRYGQAEALNAVGWGHLLLGDPQQARPFCRQALAMSSELGNRTGEAASWDSLGWAELQLGRHDDAVGCYQRALGILRELGDRFSEAEILAHLGDASLAAGQLQQAREAWQRALDLFEGLQVPDADQVRAKLRGDGANLAVNVAAT